MSTRTVRLDSEAENALEEIRAATGLSISQSLKRGLTLLQQEIRDESRGEPWEVYERLDLGPGGYAIAPSDAGRAAVRAAIERGKRR